MIRSKTAWLAAVALAAAPAVLRAQAAPPPATPLPASQASVQPMAPKSSGDGESTALLSPADFTQCDGYGVPTKSGDGMTNYNTAFGLAGVGGAGRPATTSGEFGVKICNRALANTPEQHWMRRVNMLRARAVHYLETGDAASALANLDAADRIAAGRNDAYFDRSLGLNLKYVRAYALRQKGDAKAAEALAMAAANARPGRQTGLLTLVALGPNLPAEQDLALKRAYARYQPSALIQLYYDALVEGRYDEALILNAQVTPKLKDADPNLLKEDRLRVGDANRATTAGFRAARGMERAYLLAAAGAPDKARAAMAEARRGFEAELADPPPLGPIPPGGEDNTYATARFKRLLMLDTNGRLKAEGPKLLDPWEKQIEARLLVASGQGDAAVKAIQASRPMANWSGVELVNALATTRTATERAAMEKAARALHDKLLAARRDVELDNAGLMLTAAPEPETAKRVLPIKPSAGILFDKNPRDSDSHLGRSGYRSFVREEGGPIVVQFRAGRGTAAMTEEETLLRGAEMALEAGKKGLIIVDRRDNSWTEVTTDYGREVRRNAAGFECELDLVFVDPANLPQPYAATPWRVIDAEAVVSTLRPIYEPAPTAAGG